MSVLSRHSSVFDDLFSVPQPEEAERVENCPVVHVPDEPEDMAHLLFALYDGRRFPLGPESSERVSFVLSALVRLGHKYDVPALVDVVVSILSSYYTTDFTIFRELQAGTRQPRFTFSCESPFYAETIEIVALARLTGKHNLLPAALFHCCQFPFAVLLHGARHHLSTEEGQLITLSPYDVELCLSVRERLLRISIQVPPALYPFTPECGSGRQCAMAATTIRYIYDIEEEVGTNPLRRSDSARGSLEAAGMCSECQEAMWTRIEKDKRLIWVELAVYFQLDASVTMVVPSDA